MHWRRRQARAALSALLAAAFLLAQPSPPRAEASVACDLGRGAGGALSGGIEAITGGAVGLGNAIGDACDAVSGGLTGVVEKPLAGALKGAGNRIFEQITAWIAEGAGWLIAKVATGIESSTTPKLTAKGFLAEYGQMARIAALLGAAMLLLTVLEGIAQGNATMLARVALVNVPLAFIATSVAYAVVQLLLLATDGLCEAIASGADGERFFGDAIASLSAAGGDVGREVNGGSTAGETAGAVAVPLFVTFLAAIIGAFAAFLVWLELLMRDAAIYVVALFMPFSLAAWIWPRWAGVLRRTGELLIAVIGAKFVIVSIVALAAGLLTETEGRVEPVLAAAALLLLASFAPFVLLRFVPFAEGAMSAAYARRGAGGGVLSGVQVASDVQILRNMARSNWGGTDGVTLWDAAGKGNGGGRHASGGGGGPKGGAPTRGPSGSGGGGSGSAAGSGAAGAAGGAGAVGAAASVPAAAAQGGRSAAQHLGEGAVARQAADQDSGGASLPPEAPAAHGRAHRQGDAAAQPVPRSGVERPATRDGNSESTAPPTSERPPRPTPERASAKPERGGER